MQEVRKLFDLRLREIGRRSGLRRMPLAQEWPELGSIAVVQDDQGTNQIASVIGSPRMGAVASDAFGGIDPASPVGGGGVHRVLVICSHSTGRAPPAAGLCAPVY